MQKINKIEQLAVMLSNKVIGRMALTREGLVAFEYDAEWIQTGFSISPFYLPLQSGVAIAHKLPFNGGFGVFNDSLPDGWGFLLINRLLLKYDIKIDALSVLDRLSIIGDSGMGALCYQPLNTLQTISTTNDILFFAKEIKNITNEKYTEALPIVVAQNGSSGGARPKVFVVIDDIEWLVKFPSSIDTKDIGKIEYTYSCIARKCGIDMPQTRLFEKKYFGVERFDRSEDQRYHVLTAAGLLHADFRLPSLDYIDLMKATWALTQNADEVQKVFRLMIFNVLTGNKDDHAKNFSFMYKNNAWCFAPAYDLTPCNGFNGNHSTTIDGQGNPSIKDILNAGIHVGISSKIARLIFDEVFENSSEIRIYKNNTF